jgi:hypothetical protein
MWVLLLMMWVVVRLSLLLLAVGWLFGGWQADGLDICCQHKNETIN